MITKLFGSGYLMDKDNFIHDNEELYRSVRAKIEDGEYYYNEGKLVITSQAFRDRKQEPSVDRAKLRNFSPFLSKKSDTDGIVSIITKDVRSIGDVSTTTDDRRVTTHSVDVIYDPIYDEPKNLAHSQITVKPEFFGSNNKQKNSFRLLRIALARLATENGWTLKPLP